MAQGVIRDCATAGVVTWVSAKKVRKKKVVETFSLGISCGFVLKKTKAVFGLRCTARQAHVHNVLGQKVVCSMEPMLYKP